MAEIPKRANLYPEPHPTAIILLSGGIDSLLVAMLAKSDNTPPHERYKLATLTVNYGQPRNEFMAACTIAEWLALPHFVARCELPKSKDSSGANYIPGRNAVLLSLAASLLPVEGGGIFFGANTDDKADYPDCRWEFLNAFEHLQATQKRKIWIRKPLIELTKVEVVKQAIRRGAPLQLTSTCYQPRGALACGRCNSCKLRLKAFAELGKEDPIHYIAEQKEKG